MRQDSSDLPAGISGGHGTGKTPGPQKHNRGLALGSNNQESDGRKDICAWRGGLLGESREGCMILAI